MIAARGRLGGYGGDWYGTREQRLDLKRALLRLEGVVLPDEDGAASACGIGRCGHRA